jgi:hypothetical protein
MSNKQQTAVEWLVDQLEKHYVLQDIKNTTALLQAKEMEKEQSHLYSVFCFKCINEKIPVIKFEDWINLQGGNK